MSGEMVVARLTVELKPFVPLTVIVNVVDEPLLRDCEDGLAAMVKSGGGPETTTETVVLCDREPLVPVTVTL